MYWCLDYILKYNVLTGMAQSYKYQINKSSHCLFIFWHVCLLLFATEQQLDVKPVSRTALWVWRFEHSTGCFSNLHMEPLTLKLMIESTFKLLLNYVYSNHVYKPHHKIWSFAAIQTKEYLFLDVWLILTGKKPMCFTLYSDTHARLNLLYPWFFFFLIFEYGKNLFLKYLFYSRRHEFNKDFHPWSQGCFPHNEKII